MNIPISLPTGLPATGAAFSCGRILATDGFECAVYSVEEKCRVPAKRPYGALSAVCGCGDLLATGGSCTNRVYVLDAALTETDGFTPGVNAGPLLGAHCCPDGGLTLTYREAVYLSDCRGNVLCALKRAEEDMDFIDYLPLCRGFLLGYNAGRGDVIEYCGCCSRGSCTLPPCVRLKGFTLSEEGEPYALISKGYPYSFLVPLFDNGAFSCLCVNQL